MINLHICKLWFTTNHSFQKKKQVPFIDKEKSM